MAAALMSRVRRVSHLAWSETFMCDMPNLGCPASAVDRRCAKCVIEDARVYWLAGEVDF